MLVQFKNKKMEKIFNNDKELNKKYGNLAKKIKMRMATLRNAKNLSLIPPEPPERRHKLVGNKAGSWAVTLDKNYRLVFEPIADNDFDEIEPINITAIRIISVEDYHSS